MLAAGVEAGRACSCIPPDPWLLLKQADGAFVGRLTDREDVGNGQALLTFRVDSVVKGRIGSTVEVVTANNGAACGIETSDGQRIGLFLTRDSGRWIGSLCAQVSPDDLLAAATLPAPNGRGPAAMFVGGRFGPARTIALDARGRTLGYGVGDGATSLLSICPGGQAIAEIAPVRSDVRQRATYEVAVREASSSRVIKSKTLQLPGFRFATGLHCEDTLGSNVVVFANWAGDHALKAALYRLTGGRLTTVWEGTAFLTGFGQGAAYLRAGFSADRFAKVNLKTGRLTQLARLPLSPSLVPDESGKLFAGVAYRLDRNSRLFVVDLRRQPPAVRSLTLSAPEVTGDVVWVSKDRFLLLASGRQEARLFDLRLRIRASFRWTAGGGVLLGSKVFGLGRDRTLVSARVPRGPERIVRRLPGRAYVIVTASR
jgi:hypothetical protein